MEDTRADLQLIRAAKDIAAARYRLAASLGDARSSSESEGCRAVFTRAAQEVLDGLEAERDRDFCRRHGRAPQPQETEAEAVDAIRRLKLTASGTGR